MSARDDIFARLRTSLDAGGSADARRAVVAQRIAMPPRTEALGRVRDVDVVETFIKRAEEIGARVTHITRLTGVADAVADFLRAHNLPQVARISPELAALGIVWPAALQTSIGGTNGEDPVGIALARAGVAETGTVVMVSGADSPTKLNYLPEAHIVILPASRVDATYEQGMDRVRGSDRAALLPRVVNWITGPSRTADIEQTILVGVHGPKRIHIVIVDDI